jgi:formate dehydrogenase subunit gamma
MTAERDEILRFRTSERQVHWAIAIPFLVCYFTATILVSVYNPNPARPFREAVSWIHRLSGVCLFVLPLWTIARHRSDFRVHWHNIREAWGWRLDDVKWLFLMGPATLNKKIDLPDQGKFNAAEKLNFMLLTCTYPLYVFTGLMIWLPGVAYLPWLVHFSMAVAATPLVFGHLFMATVNPDTRVGLSGMFSGLVDRRWAKHHYRRWYDENFGHDHEAPEIVVETVPVVKIDPLAEVAPVLEGERPQPRPRLVCCPSYESRSPVVSWAHLNERVGAAAALACAHCGADIDVVSRLGAAHDSEMTEGPGRVSQIPCPGM